MCVRHTKQALQGADHRAAFRGGWRVCTGANTHWPSHQTGAKFQPAQAALLDFVIHNTGRNEPDRIGQLHNLAPESKRDTFECGRLVLQADAEKIGLHRGRNDGAAWWQQKREFPQVFGNNPCSG